MQNEQSTAADESLRSTTNKGVIYSNVVAADDVKSRAVAYRIYNLYKQIILLNIVTKQIKIHILV